MATPSLLVLAAGIGSRYGGLKQIDPVGPNGEIVLDYSLYDAWRAGFGKVVFVIQAELEGAFREHFGPCLEGRLAVDYVHQRLDDLPADLRLPEGRTKPWGTGHAIRAARNAISEPFGVINADDFYGRHSYQVLGDFLRSGAAVREQATFCMVAFRLANTLSEHGSVSRGICGVDSNGFLRDVVERTSIEKLPTGGARFREGDRCWQQLTGDEPASLNLWGFTPALFAQLEAQFVEFLQDRGSEPKSEFFIPTVVDTSIKRGHCRTVVLHTDERWFGMTYREDRKLVVDNVAELVASGVYPARLWA